MQDHQGAAEHVLRVGQDAKGRWIVQESDGGSEGLFTTREAALHFARWECRAYAHARVELAATPLASILSH